jgi:hypothetical protein
LQFEPGIGKQSSSGRDVWLLDYAQSGAQAKGVEGMDVVNRIARGDKMERVEVIEPK